MNKDGSLFMDQREEIEKWMEYFDEYLNNAGDASTKDQESIGKKTSSGCIRMGGSLGANQLPRWVKSRIP